MIMAITLLLIDVISKAIQYTRAILDYTILA